MPSTPPTCRISPGAIELFHGYTYSGHPLACAAALAALDTYAAEGLFDRAIELGEYWQTRLHSLRGLPNVVDIRNFGLIGAVELAPRKDAPAAGAMRCSSAASAMANCWCAVPAM